MSWHRIELFRIFGFAVRADASWLLLALAITWLLGAEVFPSAYPGIAAVTAWTMGAAAAVGLFASILFHELAHALVARHYRLPVKGITLFIFGGVAELADEPPSAESEFVMAAAGPAASVWLAGALGLAWLYGAVSGWPLGVGGVLGFLALANALLAALNLVPGFPLDGGRMLRSLLWALRGDLPWATRIAAGLGSAFGIFLIALGVVAALSGQVATGVWWALVGLLIRFTARMSYQQAVLRRALAGEPVGRLMKGDPVAVPRAISVEQMVEEYVYRHRLSLFPVVDEDRLVGYVTPRKLRLLPREEWGRQSVGAVAERCGPENTVTPDTDALDALGRMNRGGFSRLMVTDKGRLVGVVTLKDLLQFSALRTELEGGAGGGRAGGAAALLLAAVGLLPASPGVAQDAVAEEAATEDAVAEEAGLAAERVAWLSAHALPVRSIEPADEDFSDLVPLLQRIGAARVVMLGEATHGDGETFRAKARLIRFLHQRMGFDVLAWEAGFFDCREVDAALRSPMPLAEAAARCLYSIWWRSAQVQPTLAYARATQATPRPLETVGFDCRISTESGRRERFPAYVAAFFDRLDPDLISPDERRDLTAMSVGLVPQDYYDHPGPRDYNRELIQRLIGAIDQRRGELARLYAPREIDYARQALVSLANMDRALPPEPREGNPDGYGRDRAMAENLLWWVDGPLAGRKVIAWAHNYHILQGLLYPVQLPPERVHAGPAGRFVRAALGEGVYALAFLSHGGEYGYAGEEPEALPEAAPGSLAGLLHATGEPYLFLDLRSLPAEHWLRRPLDAGFYFHQPQTADWARLYDGVFFIDRMKPATAIPEGAQGVGGSALLPPSAR